MLLTVLSVPECPNTPVLLERLHTALALEPAHLDVVVIENLEDARRWRMAGSPTLLLEGQDPFAQLGVETSVSCRLYRSAKGGTSGSPAVTELRAALAAARPTSAGTDKRQCIEALDRGGRGRLAPAEGGLRVMQQALLVAMARSGRPPDPTALDTIGQESGRQAAELLRELAAQDFVTLEEGSLRAIYPFSTLASKHRVRIAGGPEVWAMCAVDALGIAPMLRRDVTLDTTDPLTGRAITVQVTAAGVALSPSPCVVFLGGRAEDGSAERVCCDVINLFGSAHSAARWAALHGEVLGRVVDLSEAAELGQGLFGHLLGDG